MRQIGREMKNGKDKLQSERLFQEADIQIIDVLESELREKEKRGNYQTSHLGKFPWTEALRLQGKAPFYICSTGGWKTLTQA